MTSLSSCVTSPDSRSNLENIVVSEDQRCLTPEEINKGLEWVSNIIEGFSEEYKDSFQEIESDRCWKKKYRLNKHYGALIYWDQKNKIVKYKLSPTIGIKGGESICENKATTVIEDLGHDNGLKIIAASKKANAWEWSDSDIRPIHWLDCKTESDAVFRVSVATFLHELIHELRNENCLFDLTSHSSSLCFSSPIGLPVRNFAKLEKLPDDLSDQRIYVDFFEQLYMKSSDESDFVSLVDEINGYIATTDTYTLMFGKYGKTFSERREIILLTNALFYTVRYAHKLSLTKPHLFKSFFGNSTNKKSLKLIFDRAEISYLNWERSLLLLKINPMPMEAHFFKQFKILRAELGL